MVYQSLTLTIIIKEKHKLIGYKLTTNLSEVDTKYDFIIDVNSN